MSLYSHHQFMCANIDGGLLVQAGIIVMILVDKNIHELHLKLAVLLYYMSCCCCFTVVFVRYVN